MKIDYGGALMTFGEKLQYLRRTKGLSQEQLAAQVNVSRQAVSKWELDAAMPDTDNILQISKLFKVTTDYLLDNALGLETSIEVKNIGIDEIKNQMPAAETSEIQQIKHKRPILQIFLSVLAIYMITFAIAIMTQPMFLPFFAMIATAVSILLVIIMAKKRR